MNPLFHIAYTAIITAIVANFLVVENHRILYVVLAVLGTMVFDLLDHSIAIGLKKEPLIQKTRSLLAQRKFKQAFLLYYSQRKGNVQNMLLHNPFFFVFSGTLSLLLCIYSMSSFITALVVFGFYFHLVGDFFEDVILGKNKEFWAY